MSVEAITWALKQPVSNSSTKFVLVLLANCADGKEFLCFPSIAYVAEATAQDPKTVKANLKKLKEYGLIEDSGQRIGETRRVIVYRLLVGKNGPIEQVQKRNDSKNGTIPKTAGNEPKNGGKQAQKRQVIGPKTDHVYVIKQKETKDNRQGASQETDSVDNSLPKASALGARLPADWVLTHGLARWALQEQPTWNAEHVRKVAAAFKDHWIAQPGVKGRKTDWDATWRNWVRKEPALRAGGSSAADSPSEWWLSDSGIGAQGKRVRVERSSPNESTPDFLIRVAKASGRGPWIDYVLKREQGASRYPRIVEFFGDALLPPDFGS